MARYAKFFSLGGGGTGTNNLQLPVGTVLDATLRQVQDGLGTNSPLYLSTGAVRIGTTAASAMYWDNTNNRLGIGTSTPANTLHVLGSAAIGGLGVDGTILFNRGSTGSSVGEIYAQPSGLLIRGGAQYINMPNTFQATIGTSQLSLGASWGIRGSGSTSATTSLLVQNSVGNNVFSIKDDENILIGSGTNGGYKLDVNGTSNIRGSLRMGEPTVAGLVRSHPSVAMNFGGGAGDNVFTFTQINQGAFQPSSANQSLIRASINQGELGTTNYGSVFLSVGTLSNSGGTPIYNSFESRQTINCSGGTTIYRGFYHNPTLTLTTGVTHRAIETVTGDVLFGTTSGNVGIGTTAPDKLLTVGSPNYGGWSNGEPTIKFNKDLGVLGSLSIAGDSSILYLWRSGAPANGSTIASNYDGSGGSLRLGVTLRTDVNIMQNNGDVTIGNNITTLGAKLGIKGNGSTSATTSLLVQNSGGTPALQVQDNLNTTLFGTLQFLNGNTYINNQSSSIVFAAVNTATADLHMIPGRQMNINNTGVYTAQASALLQVDSTTKGFLPPRVTTAQKNAISLPANGLMVYDTDLVRPCFFNGATWITL